MVLRLLAAEHLLAQKHRKYILAYLLFKQIL